MNPESKSTLGELIFEDIEKNEYLQEIYGLILSNYISVMFGEDSGRKDVPLKDALSFVILLSKSNGNKNSEKHKLLAQEMIALLHYIYPENADINYLMGTILTNVGNFPGVALRTKDYQNSNPLERVYDRFNASYFRIPTLNGETFNSSQKEVFDHLSDKSFSYSGPTSMGKSFLVQIYIKSEILKGSKKNFAIIVPTKALINEISSVVINSLKDTLNEKNYRVVTSLNSIALEQRHHFIYVMTPERLLYLLIQKPDTRLDFVFIDEAHKISEKDERSAFYYKVVDILSKRPETRIVFASPNIPNPGIYLSLANPEASQETRNQFSRRTLQSPVNQLKFLIDFKNRTFKTYSDLTNDFISERPIPDNDFIDMVKRISKFGTSKPNQSLVYCSSKDKAIRLAEAFAETCEEINDPKLNAFSDKIAHEINRDYFLVDFVKKGVAFHIGYLPSSIRQEMESLFKDGLIRIIFCTSTLIEGVNMPADNLFVTNYKNGSSKLTPIEFKNLIGRVGRIKYNLFGNVFLVVDQDSKQKAEEEFSRLIKERPLDEKLSLAQTIKGTTAKVIIEKLKDGDPSLDKNELPSKPTNDDYFLARKFSSILLSDISSNRNSLVKETFVKNGLSENDIVLIKEKFADRTDLQGNDINTTLDQAESLARHIAIAEGDLCYPAMDSEGRFNYDEAVDFLNQMADIFYWDKYEWNLVGKNNRAKLRHFAVLLTQWMHGDGLGFITKEDLDHRETIMIDGEVIPFDPDSIMHKNIAIAQTLEQIQNVVLFKFSNYFLKFSTEYKKQYGEDSLNGKDWYEFVEFGSNNIDSIFLQRNGYSRESAMYILGHSYQYLVKENRRLKIKKSILECNNEGVRRESADIYFNSKDLFVE